VSDFGIRNSEFGFGGTANGSVSPKSEIRNPNSEFSPWHLILDGELDGVSNMAIDAALLEEVERCSEARTVVRFYRWRRPTISLGRNQKVEMAVDLDYCRSQGFDIVHRPTGGRAVLHDDELTYAVISNDTTHFGDSIYANYRSVSEALCDGFNRVGVPARLAPETRKPSGQPGGGDPPCFLSTSRYELTVQGRKIVGSAQRRLRRSFLQHGSMPICCDREVLARATRMPDSAALYREMAGLAEFLPQRPTIAELTNAFVGAFQERFGIGFSRRVD
jgi:lipoate-protein ligase A